MTGKIPSVVELLRENGPLLTSDISKMYREMGVGESAARQRVRRRSEEAKTLTGLPFPKNARFLFLEGDFGDVRFFKVLIEKLDETNSSYSAAISGMIARKGICLKSHWDIVSGAPVLQKKHIASSEILRRLVLTKLITEITVTGIGNCLILNHRFYAVNFEAFRARLSIERILTEAVRNWAIKMGFSSTNVLEISSPEHLPQFSTFCFDLVGPSFLHALSVWKKNKPNPGFFVCDVIWQNNMKKGEIDGFLKKIDTLKSLRSLARFQPMLVAASFDKEALFKSRSKGVMTLTPETLFGRDVAEALFDLLTTLEKSAQIAIGNPEKIEKLFNQLSSLDGNIRGALFELVVGHIVKELNAGSIDIGVMVSDYNAKNKDKADIDVRLINQEQILCYECKGHEAHVHVTKDEVKYWLEKQVPIIRAAHNLEQRFNGLEPIFEFWTTSSFAPEALEYLEERKVTISKYQIEWRDGEYIKVLAKRLQNPSMIKVLDQFYFKDPISKALPKLASNDSKIQR